MLEYLQGLIQALNRGVLDGFQREPARYDGTSERLALYNAASTAVRAIVYGPRQ